MDGWLQGPSDHSGLRKERGLAGRSLEGLRLGFGVVESPRGEDTIQEGRPKGGPIPFTLPPRHGDKRGEAKLSPCRGQGVE